MAVRAQRVSAAYARIEALIADDFAVILDGGNPTELGTGHAGQLRDSNRGLWGPGRSTTRRIPSSTSTRRQVASDALNPREGLNRISRLSHVN
jgi:hypothetical protein